jgi:formate hydrogenlyase transcriptional activator
MGSTPSPSHDRYLTLIKVSRLIAECRCLDDLLHDLAEHLHELFSFQFFALVLYDEKRNVMRMHSLESFVPSTIQVGSEFPMEDSASAWVRERQEALVIPDLAVDTGFPRMTKNLAEQGLRSACVLPLTTGHRRLGTLNLGSTETNAFNDTDLQFARLVADQVAVAVDNALHHQEAKTLQEQVARDRDRLQLLLDLNNQLVSNLDLRELFHAISTSIRRVMQCNYAALSLPEGHSEQMRLYALDFPEGHGLIHEEMVYPMEGSGSGQAFQTREVFTLSRPEQGWAPDSPMMRIGRREGLNSFCFLPLITRNGCVGTLNLARFKDTAFTEDELNFLQQAASQVAIAVENALDYRQIVEAREHLAQQGLYLKEELRTEHNFDEIIGESAALVRVLKQVETVAPTDSTVLILGETGTGKELIARAIHNLSSRRDQILVKVNCAAIPLGLLESELFGHEKGAFTGAIAHKTGRFELANKGTLFLDEVGDIPLELQSKLLRVLQEQEFERLGSNRTQRVDVRLIAATNRDLGQMVADRQFRNDLFYRLNVFPVSVPALRDRPGDIPHLIRHFTSKYARQLNKRIESIPDGVMTVLTRYHWPGNIRELQNFIERAVILSPGTVLTPPLGELQQVEKAATTAKGTLHEAERSHIVSALRESNWVIGGEKGAASRLGLKRTTLLYKMQKLGISKPQSGSIAS